MADIVSSDEVLRGAPRIEGTRIGVHHIVKQVLDAGESPAQVAADYELQIADVHRALVYHYEHTDEMRRVQAERGTTAQELAVVQGPADFDTNPESEPEV